METSVTILPPAERAALALLATDTEKKLAELAAASKAITVVTNGAGRDECHAAYMLLKNARVEVEKRGKEVRDDATKFGKAVIAEEKRLIGITEAEELRLKKLRDDYDAEQERIAEEARKAEKARVDGIRARIEDIRNQQIVPFGAKAADIKYTLDRVKAIVIDDSFAEFKDEATAAKQQAQGALMLAHNDAARAEKAAAEKAEADRIERERLAAERAEIERQQAELKRQQEEIAAQQAALREKAEEEERAAQEILQAEREAFEKQQREERERLDRERAELDRQRAEIEAAKNPAPAQVEIEVEAPVVSGMGDAFPPEIESPEPHVTPGMTEQMRVDLSVMRSWLVACVARAPSVQNEDVRNMIHESVSFMNTAIEATSPFVDR